MSCTSSPPAKSVAIVRFSAAGDVLLTSATIDALAAAWPNTRLVFVTHARLQALMAHNPHLHAVESLPPGGSLLQLARRLRQRYGVDAVLDLHGSLRSRLLGLLLWPKRHVRWHKRSLVEWLEVRLLKRPYWPKQRMATRLHAAAERLVGRALPLQPYVLAPVGEASVPLPLRRSRAVRVGMSVGAGWATKRWPVRYFAAVARAQLAIGREVVLFGSAAERELTKAVKAAAPGCLDMAGVLDWPATFAAVRQLDAFVAGDTGPMHLARGLGVATVALFTSTPAEQFDLTGHAALQAQLACSPCSFYGRDACPKGHAQCLTAIEPAVVCDALEALLHCQPTEAS